MSDWVVRNLEEACSRIGSGGTPSRKVPEYFSDKSSGIPWVKTKEFNDAPITVTEEYISELGLKESSAQIFPVGTILMAMYGATVGKLAVVDAPLSTNQAVCALVPDPLVTDSNFLFYLLLVNREKIVSQANGAAQQNLSAASIKRMEFLFPPLEQQQLIGRLLATFDELIGLNQSIIDDLNEYLVLSCKELASQTDNRVVLAEIATVQKGISYTTDSLVDADSGAPMLNLGSFARYGGLKVGSTKYFSGQIRPQYKLHKSDLVVAGTDLTQSRDVLGQAVLFPFEEGTSTLDTYQLVSPSSDVKLWLYGLLKDEQRRLSLASYGTGTTVVRIPKDALNNLTIPWPDESVLRQWGKQARILSETLFALESEIVQIRNTRDELMPLLISGKMKLSVEV